MFQIEKEKLACHRGLITLVATHACNFENRVELWFLNPFLLFVIERKAELIEDCEKVPVVFFLLFFFYLDFSQP